MFRELTRDLRQGRKPVFAFGQTIGIQIVVLVVNLMTGVLTARLLGPAGRGIFSAVTLWPQLIAMIAMSGIGNAVIFRLRVSRDGPRIFAASLIAVLCTTSVLVILGAVLIPKIMYNYDYKTALFAQICLLGAYINSLQMLIRQLFVGLGNYTLNNVSGLVPQLLYLFFVVLCVITGQVSPLSIIVSLIAGATLALLFNIPYVLSLVRPKFKELRNEFLELGNYAGRASASDVVGALAGNVDRIMLVPLVAAGQLGLYTVAFSFSRVVFVLQPAIVSVFFSSMSGRDAGQMKLLHDRAFRLVMPVLAIGTGVAFVVDRRLLTGFYGPDFAGAVVMFRLLVIEAAFSSLAQITSQLYLSMNRPGLNAGFQVLSFMVTTASVLVLTPIYGAAGAASALLCGALFRTLLLLTGIRTFLGLPFPRLVLQIDDLKFLRSKLFHESKSFP